MTKSPNTGAAPRPGVRRRGLLKAGLAAAATGPLAACGRSATLLRFWAMGREGAVAGTLAEDFEREHPGIRVKVEALPWTAAHEKLLTAFAGDATPDLAQMGNTWLAEMHAIGALEPLDGWLARSDAPQADDYFPGIWGTNLVDGARVGLPWYVDTRLLFIRHDLLRRAGIAAAPRDWAQWRDALTRLQADGIATPFLLPTNEFEPLLALALQQGEPLLRDGGRYGAFSTDGFRRAMGFYLERFARGESPELGNQQISNVWQEFGRGNFVFYCSGPWNIGEFKRRLPAELANAWTTAELPGPGGPGASIAGGASLVMFRRSKMKEAAWALMRYFSRPDVQLRFYTLNGDLPPRRSAWAAERPDGSGTLATDRHAAAFHRQLERVVPTPAVPEWERIMQEMQLVAARSAHAMAAARPGAEGIAAEAERAARALDARTDALLEKRRWMLERAARRAGS